jgi:hypothetical protein
VQTNHKEIERNPPRRHLDKQEAIRHLVHGAIQAVTVTARQASVSPDTPRHRRGLSLYQRPT